MHKFKVLSMEKINSDLLFFSTLETALDWPEFKNPTQNTSCPSSKA
jgi:hypothetical protein